MSAESDGNFNLLTGFRAHYHRFEQTVQNVLQNATDSIVLARLGDDVDEYASLVHEYSQLFDPNELALLQSNLALMQNDIRIQYQQALDASHHGRPTVVEHLYTGERGRPCIYINPEFLRWAYGHRSISGIARFLHVDRSVVRNALLDYGIAEPQENPFIVDPPAADGADPSSDRDDILDPDFPLPHTLPNNVPAANQARGPASTGTPTSFTGPLSVISDNQLDEIILRLRSHYHRAGLSMIDGMLRRLGYRVPRERIRESLIRIDPVQRVFQRIRIRRRVYQVPGPNSLWHHDGQHGLIRWGIVIHGFIDGYSRLITGLRASDNNSADTVLNLFMCAAQIYGVPSRMRGDHGVENLRVALFMERTRGVRRGSYIWGRSVHNVRIERLWVDVTIQIGATWAEYFTTLELRHGLDINNINHIWLLHLLFLTTFNQQLSFFAESWNQHRIQIRDGPNRSPADLFGFDMLVHGVRGDQLPATDTLTEEELEVFGVDWEGLQDERLLHSQQTNNSDSEGWTSWVGRVGPPENLSQVVVEPPNGPLQHHDVELLINALQPWFGAGDEENVITLWNHGLAFARTLATNMF